VLKPNCGNASNSPSAIAPNAQQKPESRSRVFSLNTCVVSQIMNNGYPPTMTAAAVPDGEFQSAPTRALFTARRRRNPTIRRRKLTVAIHRRKEDTRQATRHRTPTIRRRADTSRKQATRPQVRAMRQEVRATLPATRLHTVAMRHRSRWRCSRKSSW
jgi:hypothetical protein